MKQAFKKKKVPTNFFIKLSLGKLKNDFKKSVILKLQEGAEKFSSFPNIQKQKKMLNIRCLVI